MNSPRHEVDNAPRRRRYRIHLSCKHDEASGACHYIAHIQPWAARIGAHLKAHERVFADEAELIETINPLLPSHSDIRNVLSHIETPEGFFYLLDLSSEEAERLGWRG